MIRIALAALAGATVVALAWAGHRLFVTPPPSAYASPEATGALAEERSRLRGALPDLISSDVETLRSALDAHFYGPKIEEARELYLPSERVLEIDGVYTEVFEPAEGVPPRNARRVLINLHGGAFTVGARSEGRLESIPVAAVARMRVVSVDYRQGPEHRFPAASEDVATVYRHLLQTLPAENIGLFGCSAGGILAAQAVAWLDTHALPRPGAIGIFCAGGGFVHGGDSEAIAGSFGTDLGGDRPIAYFEDVDVTDPLVSPIEDMDLLGRFPPVLIITGTRDPLMSPALVTHQRLIAAGVASELHVYEGMHHFFFADTGTPESKHAFDVMARFFDRHLGH